MSDDENNNVAEYTPLDGDSTGKKFVFTPSIVFEGVMGSLFILGSIGLILTDVSQKMGRVFENDILIPTIVIVLATFGFTAGFHALIRAKTDL